MHTRVFAYAYYLRRVQHCSAHVKHLMILIYVQIHRSLRSNHWNANCISVSINIIVPLQYHFMHIYEYGLWSIVGFTWWVPFLLLFTDIFWILSTAHICIQISKIVHFVLEKMLYWSNNSTFTRQCFVASFFFRFQNFIICVCKKRALRMFKHGRTFAC